MALRYLLFEAGACDLPACRWTAPIARSDVEVIRLGRYILLVSGASGALPLTRARGAVVGSLFRDGPPSVRVLNLDDWESDVLVGDAERMGREFWGSYVAVLCRSDAIVIRRDPSGALPCLLLRSPGSVAVASDPDMFEAAGLWRRSVNPDGLARSLWTGNLPHRTTALAGIEDLQPGTEIVVSGRELVERQWWSPWQHVHAVGSAKTEPVRVEAVVRDAVASLCQSHDKLLLGVSGGLDSSIVACAVPDASDRLSCFTASTEDARGDERHHARELARHLNVALKEERYPDSPEDLWSSASADLPTPRFSATVRAYARLQARIAAEVGADAHLSGLGGDNVFGFTHSASPVVDRLKAEGFSGAMSTVVDVATITGASVWAVTRAAWSRWRAGPAYRWRPDGQFLVAEVVRAQADKPVHHRWLEAPRGALPGKAAHVAAVLRIQAHVGGALDRSQPPMISPLASQPVVEACLAMPSWRWCKGGVNRSIARAAFSDSLPASIVVRRSKGTPDDHQTRLFQRFRPLIAERLLDGVLASHRIVDRGAIATACRAGGSVDSLDLVRIFALLDAEIWAEGWSSRASRITTPVSLEQSGRLA